QWVFFIWPPDLPLTRTPREPDVHDPVAAAGVAEEPGVVAADRDLATEVAQRGARNDLPLCIKKFERQLAVVQADEAVAVDSGGVEVCIRVQVPEPAASGHGDDPWVDEVDVRGVADHLRAGFDARDAGSGADGEGRWIHGYEVGVGAAG